MHIFSVSLTEPELIETLVVESVRGYAFEEVLEQVYKTESKRLAMSQALIVRAPVAIQINPTNIADLIADESKPVPVELKFLCETRVDLAKTFDRFPGRPVHLLFSYDHNHYLSANLNPTSSINPLDNNEAALKKAIKLIRETEINVIVEGGRARFPAIPGVLYEAPNGRLVRSFLRIGNIQRSRAAIDAIFFWLLPHLRNCAGIITDTWSIGSVALNASRRLSSYYDPAHRPCPVEMVSAYLDGSEDSVAEAADHITRLLRLTDVAIQTEQPASKIVFLMSAISTGEFLARTRKLLDHRQADSERVRFVSLFNLGTERTTVPCLADWSKGAGYGDFSTVDNTTIKNPIDTIKIDPQTYFPTSYKDVQHVIREPEIRDFRHFLDRYGDASIVRVHRNVTDDGAIRHHAISVDTDALCAHATFQKRLREKLSKLEPPPKLIITPVHAAGKALADIAKDVFRNRVPNIEHIMHPDLVLTNDRVNENQIILDRLNRIDDQSSILILDDAYITGGRLNHYQLALRHAKFRGRIHYLVAVARPAALSAWEYRCRMLRARSIGSSYADEGNTVSAVETFVLPDWDENKCPWCSELQIYHGYANRKKARLSPFLKARRQFLEQSMHTGVSNDLFLKPRNVASLNFTRDSKFAPLGTAEAAVFASVASAIQILRTPEYEGRVNKPALGSRHYPVSTVLDSQEFLFGTYTDSLLRACILRAARDYELVYANQSDEEIKTQYAIKLITATSPIENDISAELVLATLANKFPNLDLSSDKLELPFSKLGLFNTFEPLLKGKQRKRTKVKASKIKKARSKKLQRQRKSTRSHTSRKKS